MKQNIKNSHTSDYMNWDSANMLVKRLMKDGNYVMACFITCGIYFGLRVSDMRKLTWGMILDSADDTITMYEQKTNKKRMVKVNSTAKAIIEDCYNKLNCPSKSQHCFLSQKNMVYSPQRINVLLKEIRDEYHVTCKNISCHSLRKTFGRAIFERACENGQGEIALLKLQSVFGHSSPSITRIYLGIKQQEILQCYDLLD